ncbi:MAG: hypothetical protein J6S67_14695 [Methanobrevibacter sp.]|nr:hypothetical protein [Methanobrevibacter sp.]
MDTLKKHTLYVGLNDKDTKTQLVSNPMAMDIVNKVCGDCSIQEITGYYTHDNGEKVKENTLKVELLFKEDNQVLNYCQDLKRLLNQESIALNIENINSRLV